MKKKICKTLFVIGLLLIWGISGGIDNGAPISNAWYFIPIMSVMWVSAKVGRFFEEA